MKLHNIIFIPSEQRKELKHFTMDLVKPCLASVIYHWMNHSALTHVPALKKPLHSVVFLSTPLAHV